MLSALIFDLDGLIVDTESPDFLSWQETCRQYGVDLALETWLPCVGTGATTQVFDPYDYLESQLGRQLDREAVWAQCRQRTLSIVAAQPILPGIKELILEARQRGLLLAVASSSARKWVVDHLSRLGLLDYFDGLACGDEVAYTKPYPDLYLSALEKLGVQAEQAIAFEDSLNGMLAARSAGVFCVVVPNFLTRHLSFDQADLQVTSLADISLDELIEHHRARSKKSVKNA
ncbi:MAG TPA: HAD family hydrolase [Ktedonobacteraceae bacterium]|nr:HAD family hydrolase [Ktedonobacteraceae bacterium]